MPLIQQRQEWYEDITPMVHGLDRASPPEQTKVQAAIELDWYHEVKGELHKCRGRMLREQLSAGKSVRGMHMWYRNDNFKILSAQVEDQMVIHTDDKMFVTTDFITFTEKDSGLTGAAGFMVDYAEVVPDNLLLFCDGIMLPRVYDGTTVSNLLLPTGVGDFFLIKHFKGRTLALNVHQDGVWEPNRIWYSEPSTNGPGAYQLWDIVEGAGFVDWVEGGDFINRAVIFNDTLVMFKRTHIGVLSHTSQADAPFRVQDFSEALGTIYPWSVDVAPFGVVYLAQDGVRVFDGQKSRIVASDILRSPRFG